LNTIKGQVLLNLNEETVKMVFEHWLNAGLFAHPVELDEVHFNPDEDEYFLYISPAKDPSSKKVSKDD